MHVKSVLAQAIAESVRQDSFTTMWDIEVIKWVKSVACRIVAKVNTQSRIEDLASDLAVQMMNSSKLPDVHYFVDYAIVEALLISLMYAGVGDSTFGTFDPNLYLQGSASLPDGSIRSFRQVEHVYEYIIATARLFNIEVEMPPKG